MTVDHSGPWSPSPTPGTSASEEVKGTPGTFHFAFHSLLDLPEALTGGREQVYPQHFHDELGAFSEVTQQVGEENPRATAASTIDVDRSVQEEDR